MPQPRQRARTRKPKEPEDRTVRFTMEGVGYEIDPSDLEWGEVEDLELYFECSAEDVDYDSMRAVMYLAYLARRRKDPKFTIEQMRKLKVSDLGEDDGPRPTGASEGESSGSQS